jgi:hypothetical protein
MPKTDEEKKQAVAEYEIKLQEFHDAGGLKSNKPVPVKPKVAAQAEKKQMSVIEERKVPAAVTAVTRPRNGR